MKRKVEIKTGELRPQEQRVETWPEIAKFFPYSESVVRTKYGPEMFAAGFIFKSNPGRKRPVIWSFPSLIIAYISQKQALNGKV